MTAFVITSALDQQQLNQHLNERGAELNDKLCPIGGDKMYHTTMSGVRAETAQINQLVECSSERVIFVLDVNFTELLRAMGADEETIEATKTTIPTGRMAGQEGNSHVRIRCQIDRQDTVGGDEKSNMLAEWFQAVQEWRQNVMHGDGFTQDFRGNPSRVKYTAGSYPLGIDWSKSLLEFSIDGERQETGQGLTYYPSTLISLVGPAPYKISVNGSTSLVNTSETKAASELLLSQFSNAGAGVSQATEEVAQSNQNVSLDQF